MYPCVKVNGVKYYLDGDRVFSRNRRLYEEDHWECQFENQNLLDRVNTRRMLGTVPEPKKASHRQGNDDLRKRGFHRPGSATDYPEGH